MPGFKVFPSRHPQARREDQGQTFDHPMQSFVWDDFTAKPDREYEYIFHPLKGQPKNLDRSAPPIRDPRADRAAVQHASSTTCSSIAASPAARRTAREFGNKKPDQLKTARSARRRCEWLSRELDDAILKFIAEREAGRHAARCCFYEFRYQPVADALKEAIDARRGRASSSSTPR